MVQIRNICTCSSCVPQGDISASGRPVDLSELMDRSTIPEAVLAGGKDMVAALRERIVSLD